MSNNTAWLDTLLRQSKKKPNTLKGENISATCCLLQAFRFFFIRLSWCPQLYMDTHHTTPLTLSNTTLKTKQDVHDTFGTAHTETVPLFVFWQVPRHTSRTKRKKKKRHRRQLRLTLVRRRSHFALFLNVVFTRTDNEKSHPEVIPGNKELRRKLFFLHTQYARSPKDNTDQ